MRWHRCLTHPTFWLIPYVLFLCGISPSLATFFKKKSKKVTTVNNVITLPPGFAGAPFCPTGLCAPINGPFLPTGNAALPQGLVGPNGNPVFPFNGPGGVTNFNTNNNNNNIFQSMSMGPSSLPLSSSTSGNTPITVFAFQLLQLGQITFTSATTAIIVVQRTSDGGIICPQTQPIVASTSSTSTTFVQNRPLIRPDTPALVVSMEPMTPNLNDPFNGNALPISNTAPQVPAPVPPIVSTTTSILPVYTTIPTTIVSTTTLFVPAPTTTLTDTRLDPYQQGALPNTLNPAGTGMNQGSSTNPLESVAMN